MKGLSLWFLMCAMILVAPHLSERFANGAACICILLGIIFWVIEIALS